MLCWTNCALENLNTWHKANLGRKYDCIAKKRVHISMDLKKDMKYQKLYIMNSKKVWNSWDKELTTISKLVIHGGCRILHIYNAYKYFHCILTEDKVVCFKKVSLARKTHHWIGRMEDVVDVGALRARHNGIRGTGLARMNTPQGQVNSEGGAHTEKVF